MKKIENQRLALEKQKLLERPQGAGTGADSTAGGKRWRHSDQTRNSTEKPRCVTASQYHLERDDFQLTHFYQSREGNEPTMAGEPAHSALLRCSKRSQRKGAHSALSRTTPDTVSRLNPARWASASVRTQRVPEKMMC